MAQSYRWSFRDIMKMSTPQILMINHAAFVRQKRLDARTAQRREDGSMTLEDQINEPQAENGKRLNEMTTEEYMKYLGDSFGA